MHIIIGNFGNHSLATMQMLIERRFLDIHFIYVNTGWAAKSWAARVLNCSTYAKEQGVVIHSLSSKMTFTEMVADRNQFPSPKFQWCAGFLKGLTILSYLDELDPACEARIVSGKRRVDSRRYHLLEEFDEKDEFYQGRIVWHPLWNIEEEAFTQFIYRAGFEPLTHRSLECQPCIHSSIGELSRLDSFSLARLNQLEQTMNKTMFSQPILELEKKDITTTQQKNLEQFDLGCGSPWACGE